MQRSILTAPVRKIEGNLAVPFQDLLAVEEPLEIRIGERSVSITMRTPGHDAELAAGFLFSEGILTGHDQIQSIDTIGPRNIISVSLREDVAMDLDRLERHFYTTSSCGVCGKASIEALHVSGCPFLPQGLMQVSAETIHALPTALRSAQAVFERTGGLHAAALFDASGNLLNLREDVGRHNAVDKLIGGEFLAGKTPLAEKIILVSGRASFELVQKTVMAGVPILAAVSAPSSLAVETARRFNLTLAGFVRDGRFNIYSGFERIVTPGKNI